MIVLDCEVEIPRYDILRRNRNRNGGGGGAQCTLGMAYHIVIL